MFDIDHNVSPFCTMYTLLGVSVVFSCFGTNKPWFGWRVRFFKLFNSINSFTVILNFLDIDQRLSPLWTIYKSYSSSLISESFGTNIFWPIDNVLVDKLFIFFKVSTLALYFSAIEYSVSPLSTW